MLEGELCVNVFVYVVVCFVVWFIELLMSVLCGLIGVVRGVGCERVLQYVLAEGLSGRSVNVRVRVRLSSDEFPDVEVDLLYGE